MPLATDMGSYQERLGQLQAYFDRTAADAWAKLTSDAPVSRIRATVRAGRDRMRATLLGWLPEDLAGCRLLDAGCGTGALAMAAARRGADVVAVDLSSQLIGLDRDRLPGDLGRGSIRFVVGDMLDPALGGFDVVVLMDSLIHYQDADKVAVLAKLAARTSDRILFTFAPRTPVLALMHGVGRLFPRRDRAPAIEPVGEAALRRRLAAEPGLAGWQAARSERIASGFYTSQAMELGRA
jgi:magnesium-protoporphyrin O-methyltransferase